MSEAEVRPRFSIVTTCYNEEANVESMISNLLARFRENFADDTFELVVVLNGCRDRTPELAGALAGRNAELKLVPLAVNNGYGAGIRAGLAAARGELIGYIDGDEQVAAEDVVKVFRASRTSSADIVKVVRVKREDGLKRLVITTAYNFLFKTMFGQVCADINGKPKILKYSALQKLNLESNDWFIDAEMMLAARNLDFTIEEIPVVFKQRQGGESNVRLSTIIEFISNMFAIRKRLQAQKNNAKAAISGKKTM